MDTFNEYVLHTTILSKVSTLIKHGWNLKLQYSTDFNICVLSVLHAGEARVLTEIQAGPLYRVVGSPLSISCNVSGFASASSRKEFEFRITKPAKPTFEVNIISTSDQGFGYAMYKTRVRAQEITLKHVSPNSVLFEIQSLRKDDEGEYDCTVKNSESVYDGTYSVKTTVKGNQSPFCF